MGSEKSAALPQVTQSSVSPGDITRNQIADLPGQEPQESGVFGIVLLSQGLEGDRHAWQKGKRVSGTTKLPLAGSAPGFAGQRYVQHRGEFEQAARADTIGAVLVFPLWWVPQCEARRGCPVCGLSRRAITRTFLTLMVIFYLAFAGMIFGLGAFATYCRRIPVTRRGAACRDGRSIFRAANCAKRTRRGRFAGLAGAADPLNTRGVNQRGRTEDAAAAADPAKPDSAPTHRSSRRARRQLRWARPPWRNGEDQIHPLIALSSIESGLVLPTAVPWTRGVAGRGMFIRKTCRKQDCLSLRQALRLRCADQLKQKQSSGWSCGRAFGGAYNSQH